MKRSNLLVAKVSFILGFIFAMFLGFGAADAKPLDFYNHPFRPSIAAPQKKVTFSISLIPLTGSTNFLEFRNAKSVYTSLMPSEFEEDTQEIREKLSTLNSFKGKSIKPDLFTFPMLHFGLNTKYFEWRLTGGLISFNHVLTKGLDKNVQDYELKTENGTEYLDLGKSHTLLSAVTDNLIGAESMFIGKIPVGRAKILLGTGPIIAYSYKRSYEVKLPAHPTLEDNIYEKDETFKHKVWGMNAMLGLEYHDKGNNFNPRVVMEVRKLYADYFEKYKPEFNFGIVTKLWKMGYASVDVIKVHDPTIKLEYMKSFLGNNEIAVGGVIRNTFGPEHMGYVALGLGGNFIKFNTMCLFSKDSIGGLVGLSIGWQP